ncbi:MAG: hypothetical protein WDM96_11580 [Lacunisphaera sp.]
MQILNTLAPVFLLIAIGSGLQAWKFVSPNFLKEANRVTYWLGLRPCFSPSWRPPFPPTATARAACCSRCSRRPRL